MRKKGSTACVLLGVGLMLAALGLGAYNRAEDRVAEKQAQVILQELPPPVTAPPAAEPLPGGVDLSGLDTEMPVVTVEGEDYVGQLVIPQIGVELPVQSEWSYPKLKKTPCRQCGSARTDDLVIAAHNYASHFGRLTDLAVGASVTLTDMEGICYHYEVRKTEILSPTETEAVKDSDYDLVLYTCTYGGKSRIVVYCSRVAAEYAAASAA